MPVNSMRNPMPSRHHRREFRRDWIDSLWIQSDVFKNDFYISRVIEI
jgi:hypothetical protein